MKNIPKISIITPSYNQAEFLEATILSVLGQNYPNLEYIIMDGGSNDGSAEIIKKYEDKIFHWQSKKDKGQADAINSGFEISTGDILMWLNSDDMLMPNILNFVASKYLENQSYLYFGNCIHFKNDQRLHSWGSDVVKSSSKAELSEVDYIIQPSSFWSREIWEKTGKLSEDIHFGFDWEWFLRVEKNFKLLPLSECISLYRIHDNHKSGVGGNKRQQELLKIYREYNPRLAKLYQLLIDEDLEKVKNLSSLKIKIKNRLGRPTSLFQRLRMTNGKYNEFTNQEIQHLISML